MRTKTDLLAGYPPATTLTASAVAAVRGSRARTLVVLDDDPTGTQSVADLPVLTAWSSADLEWALGTGAAAVYVMTNARSLDPAEAEERNRGVARAALSAASRLGVEIDFVSRSDSTLRGHFPLEPLTLVQQLARAGAAVDGIVVVPAFGDAGRITVGSVHYAGSDAGGFVPVGETEFARDASFGYTSSDLRAWVEEKSAGRIAASTVVAITLDELRADPDAAVERLLAARGAIPVVVDCVEESDLHALALILLRAQQAGRRFVYRVGPPFVRGFLGREVHPPLTASDIADISAPRTMPGGLVVVGSHVELTTRQLEALCRRRRPAEVEIDVATVLGPRREGHLGAAAEQAARALGRSDAVLRTSRTLVRGRDGAESLGIARVVSNAVVTVVRRVLSVAAPRFVVAKGGITSSDVATRGLGIRRAIIRGPLLPGMVSLWEPIAGPARGIPYVVFPGNVGSDESLVEVLDVLSA